MDELTPLISIIVPVYNGEAYIANCLESILAQAYPNLEIIAIDDGSKDTSGAILDEYAKKYNNIIVRHIPNGGVMHARSTGIRMASGEWIGFVDCDDEIEPDMYERLYQNAILYGADISHCGQKTMKDGEVKHYFYNTGKIIEQDHISGLRDLIEGVFIEPGLCNKLFRRELFESALDEEIMNRGFKINEDLLLNYLLFSTARKSIYEDFCPYRYMIHENTATRGGSQRNQVYDSIEVRLWIMEHAEEDVHEAAKKRYLDACISGYTELLSMPQEAQGRKQLRQEIMKYKEEWKELRRNTRIKCYLGCYAPHLYLMVHRIYVTKIQRKVYE